jgi:ribonuclease D
MSLLSELRNWRNNQARIEGVEGYRVLSNTVLQALVGALPQTRDEMLAIKGIKEAKFSKYGATLLRMIAEQSGSTGVKKNLEAGPLSERKESRIKNQELETEQNFFGTEIESIDFENEEQALVDQTLTVSQFLDGLNIELSGMAGQYAD